MKKELINISDTMKRIVLSVLVLVFIISCDDGFNDLEDNNVVQQTSGFVVVGTTASNTAVVKYFPEIPTGTVDITDGFGFQNFLPNSCVDHAIFLPRPDGFPGFSKYIVGENGGLFEAGSIPTLNSGSFRIDARDSNFGVFQDRATSDNISVFNPTTMEVINGIDMTEGFVPDDIAQRYQRFIFRGDDVFAPIRGNVNGEIFTSFILHQANLASGQFVGDTQRDGNGVAQITTFNDFGQSLIDPAGNLYVTDAGNFTGQGVAAAVSRIPPGSNEIDPSYNFLPSVILNPANVFLPIFVGFKVLPNGQAIARVNASVPDEVVAILVSVGFNIANLTLEQIDTIFNILFTSESASWCVLDLDAQTVTPIPGVPPTGVFSASTTFFHEGGIYLPVATQAENGFYRYDWTTEEASEAFQVTGADISIVVNIANDN